MNSSRLIGILGVLLMTAVEPGVAQSPQSSDSSGAEIRVVLRAFYLNLTSQNWDGLAAYVLSPKLLERRGAPADLQMVVRDRVRGRGRPPARIAPRTCPTPTVVMIDQAEIRLDGDWAEVSVPRCSAAAPGVDEFGMLYFERRWRFIYTDLFEAPPTPATAAR